MTQEDNYGIKAYLRLMALFARHKILYPYILPSDDDDVVHYCIYKPANELADLYDSIESGTLLLKTNVKKRIKILSNQIWYACNQRTETNLFPRDIIELENNEPFKIVCNYLSLSPDKLNIDTISTIAGHMEIRIDKVSIDVSIKKPKMKKEKKKNKVFVVHGHDEDMIKEVACFLSVELKLKVTLLKNLPDKGNTIIEKLEKTANNIDYSVVLLSPDDFGGKKVELEEKKDRARQNVIFEWGYFVAKLGRSKVCALRKGDVEIPSDLDGVLWKPYGSDNWKHEFKKELESAGITN